jgi:uncharacterized repeat protein (TIGR01451 family)
VIGPITLTPGDSAWFTGSYQVPSNCCVVSSTLIGTGTDVCGQAVSDSDTAECTVTTTPRIVVTQVCPTAQVAPGDPIRYTGTVSNAGNITLIQVKVETPTAGLVLGPITLAPGEVRNYSATYVVPDSCTWRETVTATAKDACNQATVQAATTGECPVIGTPRIAVVKVCPTAPTPKGGVFTYTGWVKNTGNVTLTNVTVVNNEPVNNTPVIGPITLAPGATANFTNSYTAPLCCCFMIDTLKATGYSQCASNVSVSATATEVCPLATTPAISVTVACPQIRVPIGGLFVFTGTIVNTGDVTLDDVYVYADQPASNTVVVGPLTLAPGESQGYVGSFVVTNCGGPVRPCVTAAGMDICLDRKVTARACCTGSRVACPGSSDLVIGGNGAPAPAYENGVFTLSFMSQVGANYTVQYKDSVDGSDWSDLETVVGTGDVLTVTDATGKDARFYRVVSDR